MMIKNLLSYLVKGLLMFRG